MKKKDMILSAAVLALTVMFLWQWISKGALINQLNQLQKNNNQLHLLTGVDLLSSAHLHADVKVYINGNVVDFSQKKYQLKNSFIHFEEGIGDVIHTHASGLTIGHMLKSVGIDFNSNCVTLDSKNYCNDKENRLKFYLNGQPNNEFDNRVIRDLDKYLISYGSEDDLEIQKQLNSVTNLAAGYSANRYS
ncbi:MAG: hypothetical protein AABX33_00915 [Nanoarchaeota archaeon]